MECIEIQFANKAQCGLVVLRSHGLAMCLAMEFGSACEFEAAIL